MSSGFCKSFEDRQWKISFSLPSSAKMFFQTAYADGLTMRKVADIFGLVSGGHYSDRIPLGVPTALCSQYG